MILQLVSVRDSNGKPTVAKGYEDLEWIARPATSRIRHYCIMGS